MTGRGWFVVVTLGIVVAAAVLGAIFVLPRFEGSPPVIDAPEKVALGGEGHDLAITLTDNFSGLRSIEVHLLREGEERALLERRFPGSLLPLDGGPDRETVVIRLDPTVVGFDEGEATIRVVARDWSLRSGFAGNTSEARLTVEVDSLPPKIAMETGLTYLTRGGSAAVVYRVDEVTARDGVNVGEAFFPGYPLDPAGDLLRRVAIYAIPVESPPSPAIQIVAEDEAGNRSLSDIPARVKERSFAETRVSLPASFLETKAMPLAKANDLPASDPTESFRVINIDLRSRNEERIREAVAQSTSEQLWEGAFKQWRNSSVTSRFAEQRSYEIEGRDISEARHFGFDLAATAHAPVDASNGGAVVFAGDLGIYGNCVILDHGLGIASLYAHLSRIDISEGDRLEQGQTLGLSGSTGLAGGDHLHFAILVSGHYVDPLEWWDRRWVRDHVEVHLKAKPG